MLRGLGNILHALGDLVIPPGCAACGSGLKNAEYFCKDCATEIRLLTSEFSNQKTEQKWTTLDNFTSTSQPLAVRPHALCRYDGSIGRALRGFKYKRHLAAGLVLAGWLAKETPASWISGVDLIAPVPLHPRRLLMRGFNQAQVLFRPLADMHGIRLESRLLERLRHTRPQVGLHGLERRRNVAGAFGVRRIDMAIGKKILVVDDVYTTGATVDECARVLLQAGAICVSVLTIAKTGTVNEMLS